MTNVKSYYKCCRKTIQKTLTLLVKKTFLLLPLWCSTIQLFVDRSTNLQDNGCTTAVVILVNWRLMMMIFKLINCLAFVWQLQLWLQIYKLFNHGQLWDGSNKLTRWRHILPNIRIFDIIWCYMFITPCK